MIEHQIAGCATVSGIEEILLIGFYDDQLFAPFVQDASRKYRVIVRYLREPQPLGTAGCLHHFRDDIMAGNPVAVFLLHADGTLS